MQETHKGESLMPHQPSTSETNRKLLINISLTIVMSCCWIGCSGRTQSQVFAYAVTTAIQEFQAQKEDVREALDRAEDAKREIEANMSFSDPRTQRFIDRWRQAEREVIRLRSAFDEVIKKTDFLFAYCEKKMRTIGNESIRNRAATAIARKKEGLTKTAKDTHEVINQLEATIREGNDVISGLEIAGALNSLGDEISTLGDLNTSAKQKLPELDALIKEGSSLLETEFGALGV